MLSRFHWCLYFAVLCMSGCGDGVSTVTSTGPVILPSSAIVNQGKHTRFRVFPIAAVARWENLSDPISGFVSAHGTFYAPLTLPDERSITLEASNGRGKAQVTVVLKPGPVEPADCLAPGQPDPRDPLAPYTSYEELPEALMRVAPSYPDPAREAGVSGTVMLQALVCACGEVSDIRVVQSIPLLDQASIDAVRQWFFRPALKGGEPVAVWVHIPVKFTLHAMGE
jgi:protein TonB